MNKKINISLLMLLLAMEVGPIAINANELSQDTENQDNTVEVSTLSEEVLTSTVLEEIKTAEEGEVEAELTTTSDDTKNVEIGTDVIDEETTEDVIDEVIEDEVVEDEVVEDEVIEDEVVEDEVVEDEVIEDEVIEDEVVADEVVEDEVIEEENSEMKKAISFELVDASTNAEEVTVGVKSLKEDTVDDEIVDLSSNPDKESSNAGTSEIKFDVEELTIADEMASTRTTSADQAELVSNVDGIASEETLVAINSEEEVAKAITEVNGEQFIIDNTGSIIAADETNFMTIGGVDYTTYVYSTLDDAINQNGIYSMNGGAQSGKYYETVYYEGQYFAHVEIGGLDGYMYLDDIQILPSAFELAEEYYQNVNGDWIKFVPVDALTSTEYTEYAVGSAPDWAELDVKYYSSDDETFYSDTIANSRSAKAVATGSSYFQNLPFRSTSDYTAADYQKYLNYVGKSSSAYYNATEGFTTGQSEYGINSLFYFSFANHESAYGLSTYAKTCNNFFGRAAIDSDPDKACQGAMGWPTAVDGILAQGIFVNQNYADVNMWTYFGTNPGNKESGMNAVYASDPNWGNAIANHMYRADQYLGGNEEGEYRIYAIKNSEPSYTSSTLKTTIKEMGFGTENWRSWDASNLANVSTYYQHRQVNTNYGQTSSSQPRVVVTDDTSNAFEYQIDTPLSTSSQYYSFSQGFSGTFPDFEGETMGGANQLYPNYVAAGYSNSNVPYGTDWTKQQVWYPKTDSSGATTYSIINDVTATDPGSSTATVQNGTTCTYDANGYVEECRTYNNGVLKYIYTYYANTSDADKGNHIKNRFTINASGNITSAQTRENVTGNIKYIYTYYSGTQYSADGSHGTHIKNRFNIDASGNIKYAQTRENVTGKTKYIYTYYANTTYGSHGSHIKNRFTIDTNGYIESARKSDDVTGTITNYYEYYANTVYSTTGSHGDHIKFRFDLNSSGYLSCAYRLEEYSREKLVRYSYKTNTSYGDHASKITSRYYY